MLIDLFFVFCKVLRISVLFIFNIRSFIAKDVDDPPLDMVAEAIRARGEAITHAIRARGQA
jgi:hypothetical protein